jgi:hypothetical protein
VSGWGPPDDPADRSGARHRQGTGWFSLVLSRLGNSRRPSRREWLVGAGALALLALLGLGYIAINSGGTNDALPPGTTPSAVAPTDTPPTDTPPSDTPPTDPAPSDTPPPSDSPSPGPTAPPEGGEGEGQPSENDNQPAPKLVGPRDFAGFERLLSTFCRDSGDFLRAALLPDREGDKANGEWACVQIVTFEPINLDEPCREEFGAQAKARQVTRDDERTWRCFDR